MSVFQFPSHANAQSGTATSAGTEVRKVEPKKPTATASRKSKRKATNRKKTNVHLEGQSEAPQETQKESNSGVKWPWAWGKRDSGIGEPTTKPIWVEGPGGERWRIQGRGDVRVRGEARTNFRGALGTPDDDTLGFVRSRLEVEASNEDATKRALVEVMDNRGIDVEPGTVVRSESPIGVQQAFVEVRESPEQGWGARVGRQELRMGREARFLWASTWGNIRRTHDGALLYHKSEEADTNFFLTVPNSNDIVDGSLPGGTRTSRPVPNNGELLYGAHTTLKKIFAPHTVELGFYGQSDQQPADTLPRAPVGEDGERGDIERATASIAVYGPLHDSKRGVLSYGVEGALQAGRRASDTIRSGMALADLTYEFEHPMKPEVKLEASLATGDKDPNDGANNTFSPVFGRGHTPYGMMDFWRLQNNQRIGAHASAQVTEKTKIATEAHWVRLDSASDSWLDSFGRTVTRDRSGNSGREIGTELGALVRHDLTKNLVLETGAAIFFPGEFARKTSNDETSSLVYLQALLSF